MDAHEEGRRAFDRLVDLARTEPKAARGEFLELAEQVRELVLGRASEVGAARLRQIIATARPVAQDVRRHLRAWLAAETDEFTKRAIELALEETPHQKKQSRRLASKQLIASYRYVGGRMAHRASNALPTMRTTLRQMRRAVERLVDPAARSELERYVQQLSDQADAFQRVVSISSGVGEYFEARTLKVVEAIERTRRRYIANYKPSDFLVHLKKAPDLRLSIAASDFLLETLFWNLWNNARQAIDGLCEVTLQIQQVNREVVILCLDNGDGFPEESVGEALFVSYSTKAGHQGRGLLEVADAIEQLRGSAKLVECADGTYRLELRMPAK